MRESSGRFSRYLFLGVEARESSFSNGKFDLQEAEQKRSFILRENIDMIHNITLFEIWS